MPDCHVFSSELQHTLDGLAVSDNWAVDAVALLFAAACRLQCSDVHISCRRKDVLIRGRRDGEFFQFAVVRAELKDLLLGRLKVMAQLPAFVRRDPQDGRISWTAPGGRSLILRCSFLPTMHGENVVVRFPESQGDFSFTVDNIGMTPPVMGAVTKLLTRREGVIAVTGPSSSGKTTTMYAMLRALHDRHGDRLNILTIEDPVEREMDFASQVPVNVVQGLTFDKVLRAALRQDPNVIMVGEARDLETARIAIQAGMTGHLVITTVHAGRASRVFTRLLSMGVEPHLVASAMSGAIAQRLVKRVCRECRGDGCIACNNTGSTGRMGLYEVVLVTESLRELILAKRPAEEIARQAASAPISCLQRDALELARSGEIEQAEYEFLFAGEDEVV